MESDSETEVNAEADLHSKLDFGKIQRNLLLSGFREGAVAGRDASFQFGFDAGFAVGFQTAFTMGKYNGITSALMKNSEVLSIDPVELEGCCFGNSRLGLCLVCNNSNELSEDKPKNLSDVTSLVDTHNTHSQKKLNEHASKYSSVFKKTGLSELLLESSNS